MKKIIIDKKLCIKCGACIAIDENDLTFDGEGFAKAKNETIENISSELQTAIESCPTDAISIM